MPDRQTFDRIATRLRGHLRAAEAVYPRAWRQLRDFRDQRRELGDWPAWCYCPLAGAYAAVSGGGDRRVAPEAMVDVAVVGALGAWRATQGIYVIDPTLLEALWATPLDGDVPSEALQRLPEWCVYLALPDGWTLEGLTLAGYWAHLEYDANTHRTELRLLLDVPHADGPAGAPGLLLPVILHLGQGSLAACVSAALEESERQARAIGTWSDEARRAFDSYRVHAAQRVGPLLGPLLYLCAENAELRAGDGTDGRPRHPHKGNHGTPPAMRAWDVGYRIGPALRRALEAAPPEEARVAGGTHATPRPHLRRAHWHTYVLGPRTDASQQRRVLRWLPPIPVGFDDDADLVPTIHPVE
jgi:hypothetical protein